MKKNIAIIILTIGVLLGIYNSLNLLQGRKYANDEFKSCLTQVSSEFLQNYSKMDDSKRNEYYYNICSNLYAAIIIRDETSYKEVENISSLVRLYNFTYKNKDLKDNEDQRKLIENNKDELSKVLLNLSMNPKDSSEWKDLSDLLDGLEKRGN